MPGEFGGPSPEEIAAMETSREKSDKNLLRGGAERDENGRLEVSEESVKRVRTEMATEMHNLTETDPDYIKAEQLVTELNEVRRRTSEARWALSDSSVDMDKTDDIDAFYEVTQQLQVALEDLVNQRRLLQDRVYNEGNQARREVRQKLIDEGGAPWESGELAMSPKYEVFLAYRAAGIRLDRVIEDAQSELRQAQDVSWRLRKLREQQRFIAQMAEARRGPRPGTGWERIVNDRNYSV